MEYGAETRPAHASNQDVTGRVAITYSLMPILPFIQERAIDNQNKAMQGLSMRFTNE